MARLHANGLATLRIGDKSYMADAAGMLDVADHHVEAALTHGARREPPAAPAASAPDRLVALEKRVAALEAAAEPRGRKGA